MRNGVITYLVLVLTVMVTPAAAQEIELDRQLIGSGYTAFDNNTDLVITGSVGEMIISTEETTDLVITQGFQQSNYVLSEPLFVDLTATKAACIGANNGTVSVEFISDRVTEPRVYQWSTGSSDSVLTQLETGTYSVTITGNNGRSVTNSITVGVTDSVDCTPLFYTGITPNGDGSNDFWSIDNAEYFQTKEVQVFNRYGSKVWETESYDNISARFEGLHTNGNELTDGTYFFIAKFDESTYKGWIEISR